MIYELSLMLISERMSQHWVCTCVYTCAPHCAVRRLQRTIISSMVLPSGTMYIDIWCACTCTLPMYYMYCTCTCTMREKSRATFEITKYYHFIPFYFKYVFFELLQLQQFWKSSALIVIILKTIVRILQGFIVIFIHLEGISNVAYFCRW